METYRATIIADDEIVMRNVEVWLEEGHDEDFEPVWRGGLSLPLGHVPIEFGVNYTLQLDDGRSGIIEFSGMTFGSHCETALRFAGDGLLDYDFLEDDEWGMTNDE